MVALDTNVLARFLLNDTPAQAAAAEQLLATSRCTAPITVFLELAWVLESCGCQRQEVASSIRRICELDNFMVRDPAPLSAALDWYEGGMDFADGLHLALSAEYGEFKTFDKGLIKTAKKLAIEPGVTLP